MASADERILMPLIFIVANWPALCGPLIRDDQMFACHSSAELSHGRKSQGYISTDHANGCPSDAQIITTLPPEMPTLRPNETKLEVV